MEPKSQKSKGTWRAENSLEYLRIILKELDRTGDFALPSIVHLRGLIAERIESLESSELQGTKDYLGSLN